MINHCYFCIQRPQITQGLARFDLQCPTDRYFFETVKKPRFLAKTLGLTVFNKSEGGGRSLLGPLKNRKIRFFQIECTFTPDDYI